jgi:hypothetical protein
MDNLIPKDATTDRAKMATILRKESKAPQKNAEELLGEFLKKKEIRLEEIVIEKLRKLHNAKNEVTQVISRQLNVNIRKLINEIGDGSFEGMMQLWVYDVGNVKTICNNLKKQNIKQVSRVEE